MIKVGNTLYLGGNFTSMRPPSVPLGTGEVRRMFGGSINSTTGGLGSWDPEFDDNVNTMVLSADGQTIFVGGDFRHVGAAVRNHAAAFNANTGALLAWAPNFGAPVHQFAVSTDGQYVYAGGAFQTVNGAAQPWAAKVTTSTGALIPAFAPAISYPEFPDLTMVRSVAISPDGDFALHRRRVRHGQRRVRPVDREGEHSTGCPTPAWDAQMLKKSNKNTSQVYVIVPTLGQDLPVR